MACPQPQALGCRVFIWGWVSAVVIFGQHRDQGAEFPKRGWVLNFVQNCLKLRGPQHVQACDQGRTGRQRGARCEDESRLSMGASVVLLEVAGVLKQEGASAWCPRWREG